MPLYTSDALILRTYKLGEADSIVVFLTRDRGKRRGVAKSARRVRSRFTGALEPLTKVRVAYFEKERRELVSLNFVEPVRSPLSASLADALTHVGYFAELIDEWAPEADPNEKLYRLGASVVEALADGAPVDPIARYFEYWLLRIQGVYPPHGACPRCGLQWETTGGAGAYLLESERLLVCSSCAPPAGGARPPDLSGESMDFLRTAGRVSPDRLAELPWSTRAGRELESVHRLLISAHLEKELKSPRVLRAIRRQPASPAAS